MEKSFDFDSVSCTTDGRPARKRDGVASRRASNLRRKAASRRRRAPACRRRRRATNGEKSLRCGRFFGKLEAGARRGGVGVDAVVEHAEAVLLAQPLVLAAHVGDLVQLEREPHARRAPDRHRCARLSTLPSKARLSASSARLGAALIGDIGRARGALEQELALVVARGRICMTVRASRSQVALSFGAAATICPSSAMPPRKSLREKAASASRRICASGFDGAPASALIFASSATALSARSLSWNGFSAAFAARQATAKERGGKAGANKRKHW